MPVLLAFTRVISSHEILDKASAALGSRQSCQWVCVAVTSLFRVNPDDDSGSLRAVWNFSQQALSTFRSSTIQVTPVAHLVVKQRSCSTQRIVRLRKRKPRGLEVIT